MTEARFGTAPFNVLRGPGYDAGISASSGRCSCGGQANLQVRFEAFNVTEHARGSTIPAGTCPICG